MTKWMWIKRAAVLGGLFLAPLCAWGAHNERVDRSAIDARITSVVESLLPSLIPSYVTSITHSSHAALISATTGSGYAKIAQAGFTSSGDGGAAEYAWNPNSTCPTGVSTSGDGITCILPSGQSAGTAGRYLIQFPSGQINARAVGMAPGGQDNSPYLTALMNAVSPAGSFTAGGAVVLTGTPGQNQTDFYYFSQPFDISRNIRLICQSSQAPSGSYGVGIVVAAGEDGVILDVSSTSPDGGADFGGIEGCSILGLGDSLGQMTAASPTILHALLNNASSTILAPQWASGDGIIGAYNSQQNTIGEGFTPGAYLSAVAPSGFKQTLTLATGFQAYISDPNSEYSSLYRLPAALAHTVTTTFGTDTFTDTTGSSASCFYNGDIIWSDAFPYGATVAMATGSCGSQIVTVYDRFLRTPAPATVTHNGTTTSIGPDVSGATTSTATASTTFSALSGYSASNAFTNAVFNNGHNNGWTNTNTMPSWLQYDLGSGNSATVIGYSLALPTQGAFVGAGQSPAVWTFLASNDSATCTGSGSSWTTLDTQTGQALTPGGANAAYPISNSTAYRCYQVHITAAVSGNYVSVGSMTLNVALHPDRVCVEGSGRNQASYYGVHPEECGLLFPDSSFRGVQREYKLHAGKR